VFDLQTGQIFSQSQAIAGGLNADDGAVTTSAPQTTSSTDTFMLSNISVGAVIVPLQTITPTLDAPTAQGMLSNSVIPGANADSSSFNLGVPTQDPYALGGAINPLPSLAPPGPVMSDSTHSLLAQQIFRQQLGGVLIAGAAPMIVAGGVDFGETAAPSGSSSESVSLSGGEGSGSGTEVTPANPGDPSPANVGPASVVTSGNSESTIFTNQLPGNLTDELATAKSLGVTPAQFGDQAFDDYVNAGSVKYVVALSGDVIIAPYSVDGVEISHAVLNNGGPVLAAGVADIATDGQGNYFGLNIDTQSGHYLNGATESQNSAAEAAARNAFKNIGITFP
jgi:hypothetical protein